MGGYLAKHLRSEILPFQQPQEVRLLEIWIACQREKYFLCSFPKEALGALTGRKCRHFSAFRQRFAWTTCVHPGSILMILALTRKQAGAGVVSQLGVTAIYDLRNR